MAYTTKLVMKPKKEILKRLNLEKQGEVQKFFTETCKRFMDPYVPYRGGDLADDAYIENGNKVVYDQKYAQYQYKGEREDGTHKINPANRTRIYHPRATSKWDKVMWSNHKYTILKMVEEKIERCAKE